jgi:Cu/Ag efflux pump CusA
VVIVGGVISATFFTLTLLPVLVMRLTRLRGELPASLPQPQPT